VSGKPRQVTRTFKGGERSAAKALAALVTEAEAGRVNRTTATVGQLLDKWLEAAEWKQRPRTLYENRSKIDRRIRPILGHIQLEDLAPYVLDAAYRSWLKDGLSPTTVHGFHCILSAAFRQAAKWGWIDEAPTARSTPPRVERTELKIPTPAQVTTLIKAAKDKDPVLGAAVALAALSGARRGELVALKWSDIDLVNGYVKIARSLTVAHGKHHTGPTKTHASRDVALDPTAVDLLKKRWAFMVELSDRSRLPIVPDPYVLSYQADGGGVPSRGGL
jgi:integrase